MNNWLLYPSKVHDMVPKTKMVELKGVAKQYLYGARVLGSMDMTIKDGEIVAVLGDEQSGKTTLLKVLAGVTDFEGQVLFDGEKLDKKPDDVIMVFDDLAIFERRSCYYNLAYPLKIRGLDKWEIDKRVKQSADRLGIIACLYDRASKTSLIDKKRLAIARLLLRDSKVVLVDDITRGLSKEEANTLWQEVAPLLKELANSGKIVIFATQDRDEAISIADRLCILHYREVKQIGTYDEIMHSPSNVWAIQALDCGYAFERASLTQEGDALTVCFEGGYRIDISHLKGKVVESYIGKDVLVGWQSCCYDVLGDRKEKVLFSSFDGEKYTLHTQNAKIVCKDNLLEAGTLPKAYDVCLYDASNENSIIKTLA